MILVSFLSITQFINENNAVRQIPGITVERKLARTDCPPIQEYRIIIVLGGISIPRTAELASRAAQCPRG